MSRLELLVDRDGPLTRAAVLADGRLTDLHIDHADRPSLLGAIILGRVERIATGLNGAFIDLGKMGPDVLSDRSRAIVTFALCGFANFSSIAIQMAVTGGLAPNQRPVIARLGLRALAAGSLSNLMSAALAGLFLSL